MQFTTLDYLWGDDSDEEQEEQEEVDESKFYNK